MAVLDARLTALRSLAMVLRALKSPSLKSFFRALKAALRALRAVRSAVKAILRALQAVCGVLKAFSEAMQYFGPKVQRDRSVSEITSGSDSGRSC